MAKTDYCRRVFPVTGMSCAACAARVEKTLAKEKGVNSAAVNFAAAEVTVEYDGTVCRPERLREALCGGGRELLGKTMPARGLTLLSVDDGFPLFGGTTL